MYKLLWAHVLLVSLSAGLCDITEGTVVPEDRCKSPTSGNLVFSVNNYDFLKIKLRWHIGIFFYQHLNLHVRSISPVLKFYLL